MITWAQNNTYASLSLQVQTAQNTPLDLTGVANNAVSLRLRPNIPGGKYATLAGLATIVAPNTAGTISYQFAPTDVATPGLYKLVVVVQFGTRLWESGELDFQITQTQ